MQHVLCGAGQGRGLLPLARTSSRCPTSTASSCSPSSSPSCPTTSSDRTVVFLDCGNIDRNPADALKHAARILNLDHHHDNTRFGTVNHVVPEASCTAEVIWDLLRRPRRGAHPADGRGAVRRAGHGHRPVHVREHGQPRARDGGRADRRRASTRTRSTGGSTRACRRASWTCSRAASRASSASTAACSRSATSRARTTRRRAPTRATPRAWWTTCAPSRARRWPGWCATCCRTRRRRGARSRCARRTTASTCR